MRYTLALFLFYIPLFLFSQKKNSGDRLIFGRSGADAQACDFPDSVTTSTEKLARYIASNFTTDKERVRAIYRWITTHIEYDVANMFTLPIEETKEQKNLRTLRDRKGICDNYATLFTSLCAELGIVSHLISGYTRQWDNVDRLPHAWCAAQVDHKWFLYDPTWGAGYINARTKKFVFWVSNQYCNAQPEFLINSHIPFDYLWQFLYYPVTNKEFETGDIRLDKARSFFNYNDSITCYLQQNELERLVSTVNRVVKNGITNALISDRLRYLNERIEYIRLSATVGFYDLSVLDYNEAVSRYNEFIHYKNAQFVPAKSDIEINAMIDSVNAKLQSARGRINQIVYVNAEISQSVQKLQQAVDVACYQLDDQKRWLAQYFSKTKSGRRSMFYYRRARVVL